jgi:5-methylcytosine-specific restriction protein A
MAQSAPKSCQRCGIATRDGRYCAACRPPKPIQSADALPTAKPRPSAAKRGYGRKWRQARLDFLSQAENQICAACRAALSTEVDHIVPHRGDDKLFWRRSNWQGLCKSCHSRKTSAGD